VLDDDPAANADARVVEVKIRLDDSQRVELYQLAGRRENQGVRTPRLVEFGA